MLKVKHIRKQCSAEMYAEALANCKSQNIRKAKVEWPEENICTAKALVLGNFGYYHNVRLTLDMTIMNRIDSYSCDCYELQKERGTKPCRHCTTLALALASDGKQELGISLPYVPEEQEETRGAYPEYAPVPEKMQTPEFAPAEPVRQAAPAAQTVEEEPPVAEVPLGDPKCMEILFGHQPENDNEPLIWRPNDTTQVFHTNTGIIGTMGTGKTQFTKSVITQLYRQRNHNFHGNTPLGILIFDYKGDYNRNKMDFVEATGAKVLPLVKLPFNPLALFRGKTDKPMLPAHTGSAFADTLVRAYRLGEKQRKSLLGCIDQAYVEAGIRAEDPATWNKVAPTFDMVYDIYDKDDQIPKNDSLEAAMLDLQRFHIFESNPYNTVSLFDMLRGVVVIDLSGYDEKIQSLIVGIILDQFYAQMHSRGSSAIEGNLRQITRLILVDEADNFMRKNFPSLEKIMKEGREFGVGTILSTQSLDHFISGKVDYSRYVLTWVVHNVSDLKRTDVEYVFRTDGGSNETESLYGAIKKNEKFHSIIKIGNNDPVQVRDKAFFELLKEDKE